MGNRKYKLLLIGTHPIQYAAPVYRRLAQHPGLDVLVAYCSLQGAERAIDPEFGVEIKWDLPLLEGYKWIEVPNWSPWPGVGRFWGLINPGFWSLIRKGGFDGVLTHTGYLHLSFWIILLAAKMSRTPLLFASDAATLRPRDNKIWKKLIKPFVVPWIYGLADVVTVGCAAGHEFIKSLGIPEARIALTPNVVDNDWWSEQAARVDRAAVRARLGIPESSPTALFCGKLQPWKRPLDVLRAFARAEVPSGHVVFVGDGPLRETIESEARSLGIMDRVRMLGFVNQSALPEVYSAADVCVLSSEYDPCPDVVCEAMLCGCPVILSDAVPGRFDLVTNGETGFVYPCGDVPALSLALREALNDESRLKGLSRAARRRMESWSPREYISAMFQAVGQAAGMRSHGRAGLV
jgi:glycosyltransferase involved in cell wall biosynthesis